MTKIIFKLAILFIVTGGVFALTHFQSDNKAPTAKAGNYPNFSLPLHNGETTIIDLSKPTIIHFWATWCAPCVVELPKLANYANNKPNVSVIAIAVQDNNNDIENFMTKNNIDSSNLILGIDPNWEIAQKTFSTPKLPESYLIDQNKLVDRINGAVNWQNYEGYAPF